MKRALLLTLIACIAARSQPPQFNFDHLAAKATEKVEVTLDSSLLQLAGRFLSEKKRRDFEKFVEIADLIRGGGHLSKDGIRRILRIRRSMNDGGAGRRKYSDDEILRHIDSGTSSETIRQAVAKP